MKVFFIILAISLSAVFGARDNEWENYKKQFGKNYQTKSAEFERAVIFHNENEEIKKHNKGNHTYKRALNKFSDMTEDEKQQFLGATLPSDLDRTFDLSDDLLSEDRQSEPDSLDYRTNRCLAPVKDQKQCGSCWAFAAVTPLEFSACNKTTNKTLTLLSEQQLVDCDKNNYNYGCNGGFYTRAWRYIVSAKGSAKQSLYGYVAPPANTCKFTTSMVGAQVASQGYASNAARIKTALNKNGPVAVAITIVNSFYSYRSGVYTDKACDDAKLQIAHAVVIVGYGRLNGIDHWVVRNSWGPRWGDRGYILMERGVNKCQIEKYAYFVNAA